MDNPGNFDPEVATNLFEQLQALLSLLPRYRQTYSRLNRIYQKCLDQHTIIAGARFAGTFAKTDYLLKEHKAPAVLRATVNDARVRMRKLSEWPDSVLADNFLYDLQAISSFVALLFDTDVPPTLAAHFPRRRTTKRAELKADCLRVVVNRWDGKYLFAYPDEGDPQEIRVFYGGTTDNSTYKEWDWSCLQPLLKVGCQLNLVRPRESEGIVYPELIIYEPDYLVDISAVASCFESYAVSPLNHLLNKLKPAPCSSAIVLGNLAGQFLDEELYGYPDGLSYRESVEAFFHANALSLIATPLGSNFHAQAQGQKQNIRRVIGHVLPELLQADGISFNADDVMVEPSFFSEMLGIQGRMDFLQLDQKVLIEQKSGRGGYPSRDADTPQHDVKHYVQLLLYMLLIRYNNHEQYERNRRTLHAFLLYSKYRNGLMGLGFAPSLVFQAICMRNEIAAHEFGYTHGDMSILTTLSAEGMNIAHATGMLWEVYQKPQIAALLAPIHAASPLERAYYLRMLTFVATEHLMAKIGSQTKENAGFADKWQSSLDDKLLAGNIYCDLQLLCPQPDDTERVQQVTLQFAERPDNDISNFRVGDIVILYPYSGQTEPDARKTMVFRATIARIETEQIVLSLRNSQVNSRVFWREGPQRWAIEHDFFESSFSSLYRGVHAFLSAPKERRDLLLLQREPRVDKALALRGDYGAFNTLALKVRQAQELFIIIGPPGTGKTSYGLMNTLREELQTPESSVLLLSYTNRAVDEICSKLIEAGIGFLRVGGRHASDDACRPYLFDTVAQQYTNAEQLRQYISQTRVFVGTTTAFNAHAAIFRLKQFSLSIIDEASQILEPHLLGLLSALTPQGESAIRKVVLIGDHKQLPAVVQQSEQESLVSDASLRGIHLTNCRLSLFERLLKHYRHNPDVVYMLTRQGRMHRDIAVFPNYTFYQNKLDVVPCPHQDVALPMQGAGSNGLDDLIATRRIAFVNVRPPQTTPSDKVNSLEAQAIAATVMAIYRKHREHFIAEQTVGVIVPYRNQIAEVRKAIGLYGVDGLTAITIDTVERYQGSQRDYILYGFTVREYYQLDFLGSNTFVEDGCIVDRKLNVAMTRAREHLILFGYAGLLANSTTFYKLLAFVRSRQGFFDLPLERYVRGTFVVPPMQPKHDAEPPSFALTEAFQQAYRQLVEQPIAADGRTQCLAKPFGRTMEANLEVLAYGRSAFRETISPYGDDVAPDEQVLLYCHYYMQRHYVAAKALYTMIVPQLTALCDACDRRLRFIDMGCGPAPAAIAFAEVFGDRTVDLRMVGIDASSAMLAMAEAFMRCACADKIGWKVSQTFDPSDRSYWCSDDGLPALVVFNCSHLFASITAAEAESLAHQIAVTAKQYPLNRYAVVVQQSNDDMGLNAYRVFCNIVSQIAGQRKQGQNAIAAETTGSDGDIYAYDVWVV